jgi:hypothetical protein
MKDLKLFMKELLKIKKPISLKKKSKKHINKYSTLTKIKLYKNLLKKLKPKKEKIKSKADFVTSKSKTLIKTLMLISKNLSLTLEKIFLKKKKINKV